MCSQAKRVREHNKLERIARISSVVIQVFLVSVAEVLHWAITYLDLGAIDEAGRTFSFGHGHTYEPNFPEIRSYAVTFAFHR